MPLAGSAARPGTMNRLMRACRRLGGKTPMTRMFRGKTRCVAVCHVQERLPNNVVVPRFLSTVVIPLDLFFFHPCQQYLQKLHMQERAIEEVKLAIKPFYQNRDINKDEYKEILRKAVQKVGARRGPARVRSSFKWVQVLNPVFSLARCATARAARSTR